MVEVICDTSFLIHLATRRIKNVDRLDVEIGQITFVVPQVVMTELSRLAENPAKSRDALDTLQYVRNFKKIPITGEFADGEILRHVSAHGGVVATVDANLKRRVKECGGTVMSLSRDSIILES